METYEIQHFFLAGAIDFLKQLDPNTKPFNAANKSSSKNPSGPAPLFFIFIVFSTSRSYISNA